MNKMILELQTSIASVYALPLKDGLTRYKKELIKIGQYIHPDTKQEFRVTKFTLAAWVASFNEFTNGGSKVPIPLGHTRNGQPEANAGWVTGMFVEGDSLFGVMELVDTDLSLTTDVSICIEKEVTDGKGIVYRNVITHVALCTNPVIVGLGEFTKLSLSIGDSDMKFLKKLAEKLGIKDAEPTEDAVMLALEKKTEIKVEKVEKVDPLVQLMSDNRGMKLSGLVKAGLITPAVSDIIRAKYIETGVLALSMIENADDGFDVLYKVLLENRPVKLDEVTGVQSLELANMATKEPNALADVVEKSRKEAGLDG